MKVKDRLKEKEYKNVIFKAIDITVGIPDNENMTDEIVNRGTVEDGMLVCKRRPDAGEYEAVKYVDDGDTLICYMEIEQDIDNYRFNWIKYTNRDWNSIKTAPKFDNPIWLKFRDKVHRAIKIGSKDAEFDSFLVFNDDQTQKILDIGRELDYKWSNRTVNPQIDNK